MVAENAKSPKVTTIKDGQARVAELAAKWRTLSEEEKEVLPVYFVHAIELTCLSSLIELPSRKWRLIALLRKNGRIRHLLTFNGLSRTRVKPKGRAKFTLESRTKRGNIMHISCACPFCGCRVPDSPMRDSFVKNYYETVYASSRKPGEGAIQFGAEAAKAWNALSEEERDVGISIVLLGYLTKSIPQAWRQKSVAAKAEWAARQAAL
jgi:hypothetical protein